MIAGSFIVAMLMAPVPNLIYQALIALPMIIMYQVAILIVWYEHRPGSSISIAMLRKHDEEVREERLLKAQNAVLIGVDGHAIGRDGAGAQVLPNNRVDRLASFQ